jgi:hypothetical protein
MYTFHEPTFSFVQCNTNDLDLFTYAWGSKRKPIQRGDSVLIHAPSYWDDLREKEFEENRTFYELLNDAYTKYDVLWVYISYYPEGEK